MIICQSAAASGNSGSTIRRKPYAATFDTTPENTASAGSGILRYASGIQPWNGNAGILIRKASAKAANSSFCVSSPSRFRSR